MKPRSLLEKIDSPQDLKKIPPEQFPGLAEEIREKIISVVSRRGGHLASNLGVVELTIALHYVFDLPKDKLIWDVSHQSYTHKLLTGRKDGFERLRQFQGISGFTKRKESEYDSFGAGHASTSISAALGMACARDQKGESYKVIAVIGDGALTGGIAFEGLNNAGAQGKDLLVILNDNAMSISKNVGAISKYLTDLLTDEKYNKLKAEVWELVGRFKRRDKIRSMVAQVEEGIKGFLVPGIIFERLGFRYFGPIDGHDINKLIKVLEQLKNLKGPIFLHLLTQKGKGYKFAEENSPKFHGIGAFDKVTGESNDIGKKTYTDIFGQTMVELAQMDQNMVAVTAAMCLGAGLVDFSLKFPKRFFDVGIAEQHGATFACGLAASGLKPVFAVYSTFLQRAFDQVIHDMALQNLPVILAIDRSGLVGEDGPTHHGAFDLTYLRQIPNMVVLAPKDGNELRDMLYTAIKWGKSPVAIRYPRTAVPDKKLREEFGLIPLGRWETLKKGKDLLILAIGSMVYPALDAATELSSEGIEAEVVNCRTLKPMDEELLLSCLKEFDKVITLEENVLSGGFGSAIAEFIFEKGIKGIELKRIGIPDKFIEHGSRKELLKLLGLDKEGIIKTAKEMVKIRDKAPSPQLDIL